MISVIFPRRSIRMKAFGAKTLASPLAAPARGRCRPTSKPPPTAAPAFSNARRCSNRLGGMLDRFTNAYIGAATADVAGHGRIDVGIVGIGCDVQQRDRRHDLPGLAVASLG